MKFNKMKIDDGSFYYVGELKDTEYGYTSTGIGVIKRMVDGKILMLENCDDENKESGMGIEYYPQDKIGSVGIYSGNTPYGPTMIFKYEDFLLYRNYNADGSNKNFCINVYYSGDYIIYEESDHFPIRGIAFSQDSFYFVELDENFNYISNKLIKYVGTEYKFTAQRMFCMQMEEDRSIYNKSSVNSSGVGFDCCTQVLTSNSTKYWGYGAIKWDDDSFYFGEWYEGNREGIGCYKLSDGTRHLGRFYNNKRSGNLLSMYTTGVIRMGNWKTGLRQGISFEIHDDCVVIINYLDDKVYGNKFEVKKGSTKLVKFNSSGTVDSYYL